LPAPDQAVVVASVAPRLAYDSPPATKPPVSAPELPEPAPIETSGPAALETGGILTIDLAAIVKNWKAVANRVVPADCAAVVKADAYGCGIDKVAAALAEAGCTTFFVAHLAEARQVRAAAPEAAIYVLNGFPPGTAATFAEINVRPVIGSLAEFVEWDAYRTATRWSGGAALHYTCDYDNFSVVIRNGLSPDGGYRAGCGKYQVDTDQTSGAVRSEMLFGQRDIDFSFTVRLNGSSKEYDYLIGQKLLTGNITITGGPVGSSGFKHKLVISFDRAAMETVVIGAEADNIITLQVSLQPLVTTAAPFKAVDVKLTNGVQSYIS